MKKKLRFDKGKNCWFYDLFPIPTEVAEAFQALETKLEEKGWDDDMHKGGRNKWHKLYLEQKAENKKLRELHYSDLDFLITWGSFRFNETDPHKEHFNEIELRYYKYFYFEETN